MYNCECTAQLIDQEMYRFLVHEKKMVGVRLGDYLVACLDGGHELWAPDRFENIFYQLPESC
jgi:hypothetical protein